MPMLLPRAAAARRFARALAFAVLGALFVLGVVVRTPFAFAQAVDAGAPLEGGARPPAPGDAGPAPLTPADGGTADPDAGPPTIPTQAAGPTINIPQSEAERAEGTPIARIDITGNR